MGTGWPVSFSPFETLPWHEGSWRSRGDCRKEQLPWDPRLVDGGGLERALRPRELGELRWLRLYPELLSWEVSTSRSRRWQVSQGERGSHVLARRASGVCVHTRHCVTVT